MASRKRPLHRGAVAILTRKVVAMLPKDAERDLTRRETAAEILLNYMNAADGFYVCALIENWLRVQAWKIEPYPQQLMIIVVQVLQAHDPEYHATFDKVLMAWQKEAPSRFPMLQSCIVTRVKLS